MRAVTANLALRNTMNNAVYCILLCLMVCVSLVVISKPAQAVQVTSTPVLDQRLEKQLDSILTVNDPQARLEKLLTIEQTLPATTPIATKVRLLSYLAFEYAYKDNFELAYGYLDQANELAVRAPFTDSLLEVMASRFEILQLHDRRAEAVKLLNDIDIAMVQASLPRVRYYANNMLASFYLGRSQYHKALEHLLAAQQAVSETDNERTVMRRLYLKQQTASVYAELRNHETAHALVMETLQEAKENGLSDWYYGDLMLLKGYIETSQGQYEAALASYTNAEQYAARNYSYGVQVVLLNNIGDIDIRMGKYDDARRVLNRAYTIATELDDRLVKELIQFNLGYVDVQQGQHAQGLNKMLTALDYYRSQNLRKDVAEMLGEIAVAYEISGLPQQQAEALKEQVALFDEIYDSEQQRYIADMQTIYDTKDKEQQIELLQQQNALKAQLLQNEKQQRLIMGLVVLIAIFVVVIVFVLYRIAQRANRKLADVNHQLADQTIRDPLTGLLNRRALQHELQRQRRQSEMTEDAMVLLDLDHFKRINDRCGHAAGDHVLIEIAKRLKTVSRENDRVIRWGGEEFLIYLTEVEHDALPELVRRILYCIAETPIKVGDEYLNVAATAGFISFPFADLNHNKMDWEQTLQLADLALYAGKIHGRNQAWGVMELNIPFAEAREVLEFDLQTAIDKNIITVTCIHGPNLS